VPIRLETLEQFENLDLDCDVTDACISLKAFADREFDRKVKPILDEQGWDLVEDGGEYFFGAGADSGEIVEFYMNIDEDSEAFQKLDEILSQDVPQLDGTVLGNVMVLSLDALIESCE
jgi:hypothetical protein